jgi:hypothetical protein
VKVPGDGGKPFACIHATDDSRKPARNEVAKRKRTRIAGHGAPLIVGSNAEVKDSTKPITGPRSRCAGA